MLLDLDSYLCHLCNDHTCTCSQSFNLAPSFGIWSGLCSLKTLSSFVTWKPRKHHLTNQRGEAMYSSILFSSLGVGDKDTLSTSWGESVELRYHDVDTGDFNEGHIDVEFQLWWKISIFDIYFFKLIFLSMAYHQ